MTILPIMACVTKHLGLGATLSTTFHHPYHLARLLASLDLLSGGRACWNVVTSTTDFEARNFGMKDLPAKDLRYDRGDEVVEACCALWDCWEEGAMIMDREKGIFIYPCKVRYANYQSQHESNRDPRSIQPPGSQPVQAGFTPRGREFAALGRAIFARRRARRIPSRFDDIRAAWTGYDRPPEHCAILPAITWWWADRFAEEKAQYLTRSSGAPSPAWRRLPPCWAPISARRATQSSSRPPATRGMAVGRPGLPGHGGQKISFAGRRGGPRNMVVGRPRPSPIMQEIFEAGGGDGSVLVPNLFGDVRGIGRMVVPERSARPVPHRICRPHHGRI